MTKQTKRAFAEALQEIRIESQNYRRIEKEPKQLSLNDIVATSFLFQPREGLDRSHVRVLRSAIQNATDKFLEPLLIWWSGNCWRLLDGYHRLEAYKQAIAHDSCPFAYIPVHVFKGTLESALTASVSANSRDKKPMSQREKSERAWKLMSMRGTLKQKDIYLACGVSRRLTAKMAKVLRSLDDSQNPLEMTWLEALSGRGIEFEDDEMIKKMVETLKHALGKTPIKYPNIFAQALQEYSPLLANDLGIEFFPSNPEIIGDCMASVIQSTNYGFCSLDPEEFKNKVVGAYNENLVVEESDF
ncbi:hypothetical protein N9L52_09095 [Litoricolaceae bacterium]|nr:hypothetical protein [Litorivicinaceae bacterium]